MNRSALIDRRVYLAAPPEPRPWRPLFSVAVANTENPVSQVMAAGRVVLDAREPQPPVAGLGGDFLIVEEHLPAPPWSPGYAIPGKPLA
ncbi:MAG: hypothetical protein WKF75_04285 [Singulisphaera sp.]